MNVVPSPIIPRQRYTFSLLAAASTHASRPSMPFRSERLSTALFEGHALKSAVLCRVTLCCALHVRRRVVSCVVLYCVVCNGDKRLCIDIPCRFSYSVDLKQYQSTAWGQRTKAVHHTHGVKIPLCCVKGTEFFQNYSLFQTTASCMNLKTHEKYILCT